jgi:tripartite-type tricarboxylate transporter receptor subunit TctC
MKARIYICTVALLAAAVAPQAHAQNYPSKPLRFVLPFPPGGPTDILGRIIGQRLAVQLGQPVVPENRPGAGGNVGTEYGAKQPPDGYTIVLASPSLSISPGLYKKLGYDPVKDFAPISLVAQIPNILLVHPSVPAKTLKEFIQLAKSKPGKLNFGSGGLGTSNHLGGEMLKGLTGVNMVHVPYKGSNEAMVGMIGGHVDMVVIGVPPTLPHIQAGRVRPLAILADKRVSYLPDVPTSKEAGVPNYVVTTSYGILAPAGTPRDIISRLNAEWIKIEAQPETKERMAAAGYEPMTSTPEQYAEFIKTEMVHWAKVIKDANIKIDQ